MTLKRKPVFSQGNHTGMTGYILLACILIFTAILYLGSINNGFNWDDKKYLVSNDNILNFSWQGVIHVFKVSSAVLGTYQPVTDLSWMLECKIWGFSAEVFHRDNLIIHLFNIILVYFIILILTSKKDISLFSSLFFAIHPMHVESVAWNSERKDVLYAFLFLLSLIFYLLYLKKDLKLSYLLLSIVFFVLSLFSKSMAITLPVILLVIDHYYGRKVFSVKNLAEKIVFVVIAGIFVVITLKTQHEGMLDLSGTYSPVNRIFLVTYGISYYLVQLVFPFNLSAIHPFPEIKNNILPTEYYLSFFVVVLIVWLIIRLGKERKYLITGALFFIITILPVLQIIPFGLSIVSERYSYVPYMGLLFMIFILLEKIYHVNKTLKAYIYIGLAFFVVYFSIMTVGRIKVWENGVSLWTDNVEKYPDYFLSHYKLGAAYESEKNYIRQIDCYTKSISLNPAFYNAYNDRGMAKCLSGDLKGGLQDYDKAIIIYPGFAEAYNNRGMAKSNSGDNNGALDDFNKAINYKRDYYEAFNNRGWVFLSLNSFDNAISDFKSSVAINNKFPVAYKNLGWTYFNMKKFNEAVNCYSDAIALSANDGQAYKFRGLSYFYLGNNSEACSDWLKAKEFGRMDVNDLIVKYCR